MPVPEFLVFQISDAPNRNPHVVGRRADIKQRNTGKSFLLGHRQKEFVELGVIEHLKCLFFVLEQSGRAQNLETAIDAHQKLRGTEPALNGSHLRAFDLPGNAAQLAGRKNLGLDPAVSILADSHGETLHPFVLRVVEGGGA